MKNAACAAGAVLAMVLPLAADPVRSGDDWPGFLGPTADGKSAEKIRLDWPEGGPPVLWFTKVGEGYSAPSVAGDKVFVFDRAGDDARLRALSADDGEVLWSAAYPTAYEDYYRYSGGPRASPVIDGDRVFAFGVEGRLRAHSVADGALFWEVDTSARYGVVQNFFGAGTTPVVEDDLLIVMIGGSPPGSPKIHSGEVLGNGSGIVAFDKATGEERYRISDELASYATPRIATLGHRRRGFAFTRGGLLGFEPTKGAVDFFFPWRAKKLESVNAATPVVVGDTVFITEAYGPGGALLRVHPPDREDSSGYEVVWQDPRRGKSLASHWMTPIHHQGHLYGSSGESTGEAALRAVEFATGKVKWSVPGLGRATLLYADGHFLVLTEHGRLLLIEANPERFVQLAEIDFGGGAVRDPAATTDADAKTAVDSAPAERPVLRFPVWNAPVLSRGRLYLRGKDQLVVLDVTPVAGHRTDDPGNAGEQPRGRP